VQLCNVEKLGDEHIGKNLQMQFVFLMRQSYCIEVTSHSESYTLAYFHEHFKCPVSDLRNITLPQMAAQSAYFPALFHMHFGGFPSGSATCGPGEVGRSATLGLTSNGSFS
jgi:hypothetical protein